MLIEWKVSYLSGPKNVFGHIQSHHSHHLKLVAMYVYVQPHVSEKPRTWGNPVLIHFQRSPWMTWMASGHLFSVPWRKSEFRMTWPNQKCQDKSQLRKPQGTLIREEKQFTSEMENEILQAEVSLDNSQAG